MDRGGLAGHEPVTPRLREAISSSAILVVAFFNGYLESPGVSKSVSYSSRRLEVLRRRAHDSFLCTSMRFLGTGGQRYSHWFLPS